MLKSPQSRLTAVAMMIALFAFALGCSNGDDAAEELVLCGNHTCGDLVMITNDTSTSGYQYLQPRVSPTGDRIAFTADWAVIPSADLPEPLQNRQILLMPMPADPWADSIQFRPPHEQIQQLGAQLVRLNRFVSEIGGTAHYVDEAHQINKSNPIWVDLTTLLFVAHFDGRDRMLIADISNPGSVNPRPVFYEPDDLLTSGGQYYYHNDPALSPDGRWLLFTRFGCNSPPNYDDAICTRESLWALDMNDIDDPRTVTFFPLTTGAINIEDPAWSPDGLTICFAATVDLIGQSGNITSELFSIRFDPQAAEAGDAVLNNNLRRLTTTTVGAGDPITSLHNYGPVFNASGSEIYFVSSRRTPTLTLRIRSLWRIPSDGRLEPEILFYSRCDDVDPSIHPVDGSLVFASRLGFPTSVLDWLEQDIIDYLTNVYNPSAPRPYTEVEILRIAGEKREELELYEDVMSHLYLFRRF